ncbi:MAG: hypothetical protein FWG65_07475 [Turicibacter sp.]|nr:hypothetical protein [Turicibacter sp.]
MMIYCDSCMRMLDKEEQFCPFCETEDVSWQSPDDNFVNVSNAFRGDVFDKLQEINQHIEDNQDTPTAVLPDEPIPSPGHYIGLVMLATCFSIAGIVVGMIYLNHANKNFRVLGTVILTISTIFILSWIAIVVVLLLFWVI